MRFFMPSLCQCSACSVCGKVRGLFLLMCSELNLTVIRSYTCANEKHNGCNNGHALWLGAAAVRGAASPCIVIIRLHIICVKSCTSQEGRMVVVASVSNKQGEKLCLPFVLIA